MTWPAEPAQFVGWDLRNSELGERGPLAPGVAIRVVEVRTENGSLGLRSPISTRAATLGAKTPETLGIL